MYSNSSTSYISLVLYVATSAGFNAPLDLQILQ
jgi:hypothetical protein